MRISEDNAHMKQRINLTIDAQLVARAKRQAHEQNTSVSCLVEKGLQAVTAGTSRRRRSFVDRWAGRLKLAPRNAADRKREYLWRKYGLAEDADSHRH
jgi:KaiC/GvpD/RAD55 family RecA-like ATPase